MKCTTPIYSLVEISKLVAYADDKADLLYILSCIDAYKHKYDHFQLRAIDKIAAHHFNCLK